jgi:hypothetical protein
VGGVLIEYLLFLALVSLGANKVRYYVHISRNGRLCFSLVCNGYLDISSLEGNGSDGSGSGAFPPRPPPFVIDGCLFCASKVRYRGVSNL